LFFSSFKNSSTIDLTEDFLWLYVLIVFDDF
jgi:hypothetical protein